MTIEQQIQETVALAKELALPAFKAFSETGNIPVQNKAQADRIIEQRKWLYANFEPIQVNAPGTRKRMGFSKEAIAAMSAHFSAK